MPDESASVDAQQATLDDARTRLTERRRLLGELSTALVAFDKDVARHHDAVAQRQREFASISKCIAELTTGIAALNAAMHTLAQWAAGYTEHNVVLAPPNVAQLETRLGDLQQYVRGPLHDAVDALVVACARLESRKNDLHEAERVVKQRDRDCRDQQKEQERQLKRIAKAQSDADTIDADTDAKAADTDPIDKLVCTPQVFFLLWCSSLKSYCLLFNFLMYRAISWLKQVVLFYVLL